jgi:hypothetical protein
MGPRVLSSNSTLSRNVSTSDSFKALDSWLEQEEITTIDNNKVDNNNLYISKNPLLK